MNAVKIKCQALMVGDWCCDEHGFQWQITVVGDDYAYATFESNEADPWEFNDKDDQPCAIEITEDILMKNGWKEAEYWLEYQDGENTIQFSSPNMLGMINGVFIEHFKCEYVHQYQHLLRLCGLNELADNFKV